MARGKYVPINKKAVQQEQESIVVEEIIEQGPDLEVDEEWDRELQEAQQVQTPKSVKNKNIIIAVCCAVVVCIITVVIVAISLGSSKSGDEQKPTETTETGEPIQTYTITNDDGTVSYYNYVMSNTIFGNDGVEYVILTEINTQEVLWIEPNTGEYREPDPDFTYSEDERALLQTYGFSGAVIDTMESQEIDANTAVNDLITRQEEAAQAIIDNLGDPTSDEFQELAKQTLIAAPDLSTTPGDGGNYNATWNGRYYKVKPTGNQLFIMFDNLEGLDQILVPIELERYNMLPDEGNMVINAYYHKNGEGDIIIYSVKENIVY